MIQKIVQATEPKLRQKTKRILKIDKKLTDLITDLTDTLEVQIDPEGVGLAATQIGKPFKVFAMKPTKKSSIIIIINPELISATTDPSIKVERDILEGCLSLPHYYGPLTRHNKIKIKHDIIVEKTNKLKTVEEEFTGFEAHVVLHEIDHLNGILFIDHILTEKKPLYKVKKDGSWERVELV